MATLRVGTLTPTALKMGTVTVVAAYMGTTAVWPLVGGFTATMGGVGKQATGAINGTHAVSANFIGTITGAGNKAIGVIGASTTEPATISYRLFNGTTDAFSVNLGNLASQASVPETWMVACRIVTPVTSDGEIVHGVSTAPGAASPGFDPVDLYVATAAGTKWRFFDGASDFPNGPDVSALDIIICVRRGSGTNLQWSIATHNGTVWSGFTHGAELSPSANRPYAATGVMEFASNPGIAVRLAAVARANTVLSDAVLATLTGSLNSWQAIASVTNLWRFDQTPVVDLKGTATQNTLTGTTVPGTFPLDTSGGAPPAVSGSVAGSGKQATGAINGALADSFTAAFNASSKQATASIDAVLAGAPTFGTLPGVGKKATGVINAVFIPLYIATLSGSGKQATGAINSTFAAPPTGTITASGKQATGAINGTSGGSSSGFTKYRIFSAAGPSNVRFTLGNMSGASSNPQTVVAVVRVVTPSSDGEIMCAPGFDPLDFFHNNSAHQAQLFDGASTVTGMGFDSPDGWCLLAFRSLVGAAAKTSKSACLATTVFPTPTHTTSGTTLGVRTWPTSGLITIGDGTTNGDGPFNGEIVCIARFSTALTDAQINNMITGLAAIQATPTITNLWMLGQATPADLVGTSTLSAVTATTLSSGDSPFPT